jgi:hypothetical protein
MAAPLVPATMPAWALSFAHRLRLMQRGRAIDTLKASGEQQAASAATESPYLVFWSAAVSTCSSSAFCQLELWARMRLLLCLISGIMVLK